MVGCPEGMPTSVIMFQKVEKFGRKMEMKTWCRKMAVVMMRKNDEL